MKDPFEDVSVRTRKAVTATIIGALLLGVYALVYPTQVAIVGVILTLPLIIMLHEAGHFVAAKRSGMKVTEFFIGFGPRIWSFRRGETEYGVKAVILGGYCRIIGMTNLEDVDDEDEPRAYRSKSYPKRVLVAAAGPAVHFVIAIVLMFVLLVGAGDVSHAKALTKLAEVSYGAKDAGVRKGDVIVAIDGKPVKEFSDVSSLIQGHHAGDTIDMAIERDGQRLDKTVTLTEHKLGTRTAVLAGISAQAYTPRPSVVRSITLAPREVVTVAHQAVSALGQIFSPSGISRYLHVLAGTDKTVKSNQQRFLSPVGFGEVAVHAVDAGWIAVVLLLLSINVFVGLVNLVPLLPFDGGHIAIATMERVWSAVTRRKVRVDAAKLMPITGVVLMLLLFILVSSLFLDITHPVSNPF